MSCAYATIGNFFTTIIFMFIFALYLQSNASIAENWMYV